MHNHDFYIQTQTVREKQQFEDFFLNQNLLVNHKSARLWIQFLAKFMIIKSYLIFYKISTSIFYFHNNYNFL